MTDAPSASSIYVTRPERGVAILHIAVESGADPLRFTLTRDQLFRLNAELADTLVKDFR